MPRGKPVTGRAKARPVRSAAPPAPPEPDPQPTRRSSERWVLQDSRSVRSVWVWRGFLMMALLAVGVAIILAANGHGGLGIAWGVIAAGWLGISMWLWRQHHLVRTDR